MGNIRESDYIIFSVLKKVGDKSLGFMDFDYRMKDYYRLFKIKKPDIKNFYLTNTTVERARVIDINKNLTPESILSIWNKTNDSFGIILTGSDYHRLHLGYAITSNHILLQVFRGNIKGRHCSGVDTQEAIDDILDSKIVGSIVIDKDGVWFRPNDIAGFAGAIEMFSKKHIPDSSNVISKRVRALTPVDKSRWLRATKVGGNDGVVSDSNLRLGMLSVALNMFIFLHTVEVIDATYIADDNKSLSTYRRLRKDKDINYVYVDSSWDTNIDVINPFSVKGHFRHQPKKNENGEWYKELIYIDGFMKKGYHRKSTKSKIEEKAPE